MIALSWGDLHLLSSATRREVVTGAVISYFKTVDATLSTAELAAALLRGPQPKSAQAKLASLLVSIAPHTPYARRGPPERRLVFGVMRVTLPWLWSFPA